LGYRRLPSARHQPRIEVVVGSDVDKAGAPAQVVDPVGVGSRQGRRRKVVTVDRERLLGGPPLAARVDVVADQLLLLRVHRDDWLTTRERGANLLVDVPKLRVAIRMVAALLGLSVALKAVPHGAQELRNLLMAERVPLCRQLGGQRPSALARPAQWGLGIAARQRLHQVLKSIWKTGVRFLERSAPPAGMSNPTRLQGRLVQFPDPLGNRHARQATRTADARYATAAHLACLAGRHHPTSTFVEVRPDQRELLGQSPCPDHGPNCASSADAVHMLFTDAS
jgi:hypothetical protein